jgi:hypothetical protein
LFLRQVVRVRIYLMWCIVGLAGAAPRRINLPHLYSHTGGDLHGGASEVMATYVVWSSEIFFSVCRWPMLVADVSQDPLGNPKRKV